MHFAGGVPGTFSTLKLLLGPMVVEHDQGVIGDKETKRSPMPPFTHKFLDDFQGQLVQKSRINH